MSEACSKRNMDFTKLTHSKLFTLIKEQKISLFNLKAGPICPSDERIKEAQADINKMLNALELTTTTTTTTNTPKEPKESKESKDFLKASEPKEESPEKPVPKLQGSSSEKKRDSGMAEGSKKEGKKKNKSNVFPKNADRD